MFGISFSELLLIGLIALLVLGPERLPDAARTAGLWIGRLKRSFNSIKMEVEREIGADAIRQMHKEHGLQGEEKAQHALASDLPATMAKVQPASGLATHPLETPSALTSESLQPPRAP